MDAGCETRGTIFGNRMYLKSRCDSEPSAVVGPNTRSCHGTYLRPVCFVFAGKGWQLCGPGGYASRRFSRHGCRRPKRPSAQAFRTVLPAPLSGFTSQGTQPPPLSHGREAKGPRKPRLNLRGVVSRDHRYRRLLFSARQLADVLLNRHGSLLRVTRAPHLNWLV